MFRRPLIALSGKASSASRTIIRDPRKTKRIKKAVAVASREKNEQSSLQLQQPQSQHNDVGQHRPPMAFEPSTENQQSLGLGSYMLAGVGVAMGVTLVGAVFGAIG
ncbi:hypothetical protein ACHAXR_002945 [Thalassiosira sp. AJA248-18]